MTTHQDPASVALGELVSSSFASRLWQRDSTLWPDPSPGGDPAEDTLGWLDLPQRLSGLATQFSGLSNTRQSDGFTDAVVLGMGGSSMTPLTLSNVFAYDGLSGMRLHAIDTVNPATVAEMTEKLDLSKTLFFVSSKSGTTVEPLSLEAHFRSVLSDKSSADRRNFVALTDPGTPLAERARVGEFGTWVATPPDVGGRFSALSAFGMMPAAAAGLNISEFAESAARMAARCQLDSTENPGLQLGAFMAANALAGRDKVTLLAPPVFSSFGLWIEQLLAESTGKNGKGLIPVAGESLLDPTAYGTDRQFIVIDSGTDTESTTDHADRLREAGQPVFVIELAVSNKYAIAGEFFRWQFATAAAASLMNIYPFDQPDVESAKVKARELLSDIETELDTVSLVESLRSLTESTPPSYVAVTAFLPESKELTEAFTALRRSVSNSTGMATTFGYGPRYLHSIGQLYKGGPQNAVVLGFVSGKYDDLAVPNAKYTFGQLTEAQAGGDFAVMSDRGQKVFPIELGEDPARELKAAVESVFGQHRSSSESNQ